MLGLSDNPPARYPERPIHDAEGTWWIAKVKPRQEKAFAFDLLDRGVEYYLPMYRKITRRRDNNKQRKSILVLFPGYVSYCAARPGEERWVFATNRVVNLVPIRHQRRFMRELDQVYHTLDLGVPVEPYAGAASLPAGAKVRVEAGPLRGMEGSVIRAQGAQKLILSVEVLGKAAVTVNPAHVRPIEEG
jgi:transcription antitermination factor NusG